MGQEVCAGERDAGDGYPGLRNMLAQSRLKETQCERLLGVSDLTGVWTTGGGEVEEVKVSGGGNSTTGISPPGLLAKCVRAPEGCRQCPGESAYRLRKHHVYPP